MSESKKIDTLENKMEELAEWIFQIQQEVKQKFDAKKSITAFSTFVDFFQNHFHQKIKVTELQHLLTEHLVSKTLAKSLFPNTQFFQENALAKLLEEVINQQNFDLPQQTFDTKWLKENWNLILSNLPFLIRGKNIPNTCTVPKEFLQILSSFKNSFQKTEKKWIFLSEQVFENHLPSDYSIFFNLSSYYDACIIGEKKQNNNHWIVNLKNLEKANQGIQNNLFQSLEGIEQFNWNQNFQGIILQLSSLSFKIALDKKKEEDFQKAKLHAFNQNRFIFWANEKLSPDGKLILLSQKEWWTNEKFKDLRQWLRQEFESIQLIEVENSDRVLTFLEKVANQKGLFHYSSELKTLLESPWETYHFQAIQPDQYENWFQTAKSEFAQFIPLWSKDDNEKSIFRQFQVYKPQLSENILFQPSEEKLTEQLKTEFKNHPDWKFRKKAVQQRLTYPFLKQWTYVEEEINSLSPWRGLSLQVFKPSKAGEVCAWLSEEAGKTLFKNAFVFSIEDLKEEAEALFFDFFDDQKREQDFQNKEAIGNLFDFSDFENCQVKENLAQEIRTFTQFAEYSKEVQNLKENLSEVSSEQPFEFKKLFDAYQKLARSWERFGETSLRNEETQYILERYFERANEGINVLDEYFSLENFDKALQIQENLNAITAENIIYYIYALLQNPIYSQEFFINLKHELPRVPILQDFKFWAKKGKELADLQQNWTSVEAYPLEEIFLEEEKKQFKFRANVLAGEIEISKGLFLKNIPEEVWEFQIQGKSLLKEILKFYKKTFTEYEEKLENQLKTELAQIIQVCLRTMDIQAKLKNSPLNTKNSSLKTKN